MAKLGKFNLTTFKKKKASRGKPKQGNGKEDDDNGGEVRAMANHLKMIFIIFFNTVASMFKPRDITASKMRYHNADVAYFPKYEDMEVLTKRKGDGSIACYIAINLRSSLFLFLGDRNIFKGKFKEYEKWDKNLGGKPHITLGYVITFKDWSSYHRFNFNCIAIFQSLLGHTIWGRLRLSQDKCVLNVADTSALYGFCTFLQSCMPTPQGGHYRNFHITIKQ
jgi:hypothetical protein